MASQGIQLRMLRDALCSAFNLQTLEEMLRFELDQRLDQLAPRGDIKQVAFWIIDKAEREGWLDRLVSAAAQANPGNRALQRYLKQYPPQTTSGAAGGNFVDVLDERLKETLQLYLSSSFKDDQYARLDQAGETDPDRTTLLRQVFVDLEVKQRSGRQPHRLRLGQPTLFEVEEPEQMVEEQRASVGEERLSAMGCFLQELWRQIVVIGGPGQGKSTLGQYLGQVHRAVLLGYKEELNQSFHEGTISERKYVPKTARIPFRVVLKYYAQWLADGQRIDSVEAYLAEQMEKGTSRKVSPEDVQEVLRTRPSLVIFDGLDEVIEPDLRSRLLSRVEDFLGRMEQLQANIQTLATSRPTGYNDQFNPERFLHLELQPMSTKKVRDYAQRWVHAKVPVEEEQRRVIDTLRECQQEEHTRLLLTTPLQVTIVLLIIKDGGRPPAQREALFHDYWGTFFRREKAKAKGVIRTEELLLFDLQAYLGYLLQHRAATENVRSLLPANEFEKAMHSFLRQKDSRSPEDFIRQRAAQMVNEARDRLYFLVEPEPGLFGFELRSLQEFFAAAYLAQTARDTQQRFERLKAIACSEHWRNVALFFAGRIVRNFSGEAANILELVCRPIDRNLPDLYLKRGAWLALDVSADGAFAANRDLQYGAVEYALTVLDTNIARGNQERLKAALRRLSPDDRRDILRPLLKQKLSSLPLSCLPTGLDAYGQCVGADQPFQQGLEALLSSTQPEYVRTALNMGFQYHADPSWLATQLERYWSAWAEKDESYTLWNWWQRAPKHMRAVLSTWSPSEDRICHLLNNLLAAHWYPSHLSRRSLIKLADETGSLAGQMVMTLEYLQLLSMLVEEGPPDDPIERLAVKGMPGIGLYDLERAHQRRAALISRFNLEEVVRQLDGLMARSGMLPHLRASMWSLYWMIHEPMETMVSGLIEEARTWAKGSMVPEEFWTRWLGGAWPLLAFAVKRQLKGDHQAVMRLQPYLRSSEEIAINIQVRAAVRALAERSSQEEWAEFLMSFGTENVSTLPELTPVAGRMGITVGELIQMHLRYWMGGERVKYSYTQLHRIFSAMERCSAQPPDTWHGFWFVAEAKWSLNAEGLARAKQFLCELVDRLPQTHEAIQVIAVVFIKLLALDQATLQLASQVLTVIGSLPHGKSKTLPWRLALSLVDVPLRRLAKLAEFTGHKDEIVRRGALILWEGLIDVILADKEHLYFPGDASKWQRIRSLRLDWQRGLSLISDADNTKRRQGITLLSLSHFPVTDKVRRTELLTAIAQAQAEDEVEAWARLLEEIPMPKLEEGAWRDVLESILAQPRTHSSKILTAAMERYAILTGAVGSGIMEDEVSLGLPTVVA